MDPLTKGDYPLSMKTLVGNRLPKFTKDQAKAIKGSFDFIGLNYYSARYARNAKRSSNSNKSYSTDSQTEQGGMQLCKQSHLYAGIRIH
jgi:beta-glucosidase